MSNRPFLSVVTTAIMLLASATVSQADEKEVAAQQFQRGMELFRDGDTAAAKQTLSQVDITQLPEEKQITLQEALKALGAQPRPAPAARERAPEPAPAQDDAPVVAAQDDQPEPVEPPQPKPAAADDAPPVAQAADADAGGDDVLVQARKLVIAEAVAEAREAETQGLYRLAVEKYNLALSYDQDNAQIIQLRNAAQAKLDRAPGTPIQSNLVEGKLSAAETIAEFNQLMTEAEALRAAGNYQGAKQKVEQAQVVIDRRKAVLGDTPYNDLAAKSRDLFAKIAKEEQEARAIIERQRAVGDAAAARERRRDAELAQHEAVQRLLRRAQELRKVQNYDQALQLVNQALFLDPTNPAAQAMQDIIEDSIIITKTRELYRQRALRVSRGIMQNIEASTPYTELITYPGDWPQLTAARLGMLEQGGDDSELNRRVMLKLGEPLPVNFEANRLVNVVDYFRNTTAVNFFVNWAALEAAGVEQDSPVTLQLNNIPADQALTLVLQQVGGGAELEPIGFSIIDGVVHISTKRDLKRTTDTRVYDIRDLLVQIPRFTGAPEFDLNQALSNTSSGGSSTAAQSATTLFQDQDQQTGPTREETIEQITQLIQDTIGAQQEWAAYGGDVSSLRELNGNLIVKTTPDNHRQLVKLLQQLRSTRAIQIHIESRFIVVESELLNEIGVDLDFQIVNIGADFPLPIGFAQDHFGMTQRSAGGGAFPANDAFSNFNPSVTPFNPNDPASPIGFVPGAGFFPNRRGIDFGLSYLGDVEVNLLVRATSANQRSITLTAPRLTLFNGQRAHVMIARQIAFVSDLEPVSGAIGFDPTISVTQSGVVLDVEATVSADRRYVTMTVRASLATIREPIRTVVQAGSGAVGGGVGGGVVIGSIFGEIEVPELTLRTVRTSVSVPDRGTVIMGGQRMLTDVEIEAGVPVLSRIPVLRRFFTNKTTSKVEQTLLILIKPTIIIQDEMEEALWPGLLKDPQGYSSTREYSPTSSISEIVGATP